MLKNLLLELDMQRKNSRQVCMRLVIKPLSAPMSYLQHGPFTKCSEDVASNKRLARERVCSAARQLYSKMGRPSRSPNKETSNTWCWEPLAVLPLQETSMAGLQPKVPSAGRIPLKRTCDELGALLTEHVPA